MQFLWFWRYQRVDFVPQNLTGHNEYQRRVSSQADTALLFSAQKISGILPFYFG